MRSLTRRAISLFLKRSPLTLEEITDLFSTQLNRNETERICRWSRAKEVPPAPGASRGPLHESSR